MIVPDWLLYAWFALAGLSTLYVAWDNFVGRNPEETVMKWATNDNVEEEAPAV
jgi:hypothetical protein